MTCGGSKRQRLKALAGAVSADVGAVTKRTIGILQAMCAWPTALMSFTSTDGNKKAVGGQTPTAFEMLRESLKNSSQQRIFVVNDSAVKVDTQANSTSPPPNGTAYSADDLLLSDLLTTGEYDRFTQPDAGKLIAKLKTQGDPAYFEVKRNAADIGWFGKDFDDLVSFWLRKVQQEAPAQDPEQIPLHLTPRLDDAALYGLAGDIVRAIEPHTESDPVALLMQLLTFFGNCINRTAYGIAEVKNHYMNLYSVLVGETSKARKGTSSDHIRKLFQSIDPHWEMSCIKRGLSTGEGVIWEVHDEIKKWSEKEQDYRIIEPNVEDKRRCILESEFALVLRVGERQGNTLSEVLRVAWDGDILSTMTKNSPAQATGAHISIVGHITSDELRRYLTKTEIANGFGNRFLWLSVKRSKSLPDGGNIDEVDFAPLIKRLREAVIDARKTAKMQRNNQAKDIWHDVYDDLSEGKPGLVGALTARAEAQVLRLQCLYALLDGSDIIRAEHLTAALALWKYCEASVYHIFSGITGSNVADRILEELRVASNGLTRTEIRDLFDRHQKANTINDAISMLEALGYITIEKETTGGRPIERIKTTGVSDISDISDQST